MQLPIAPDRAQNSELIEGSVLLAFGLLLLVPGVLQFAGFLAGNVPQLTIEPLAIPAGIGIGVPGALRLQRALRLRRVMRHGVHGEADLLGLQPTKATVDGHPVIRLRLRVRLPGVRPYEVTIRSIMGPYDGTRLIPGRAVPVRVHPRRRKAVVIGACSGHYGRT